MTNHHSWRKGRICDSCSQWKLLREFKGESRDCRACSPSKRTPIPRPFVPRQFLDFTFALQALEPEDEESLAPAS